jgi:hypothetical protein
MHAVMVFECALAAADFTSSLGEGESCGTNCSAEFAAHRMAIVGEKEKGNRLSGPRLKRRAVNAGPRAPPATAIV